jgi:hypothetical protein
LKQQRSTVQSCAFDHSFSEGQVYPTRIAFRLFFDPKVVAMLAEIFMVRSEAEARLVEEVLPSSTSRFIPFSPSSQLVFKETGLKGDEAPRAEQPVNVIWQQKSSSSLIGEAGQRSKQPSCTSP